MRRKLLKLLIILVLILLVFFGVFGAWTWYQMNISQSLAAGDVQPGTALGGLVIPQTAVLYGLLAGFFLLLTVVSIWFTYHLVMVPPENDEEE
jgi:TRAP-type C4-dicarboxylate transport system permease small subunit